MFEDVRNTHSTCLVSGLKLIALLAGSFNLDKTQLSLFWTCPHRMSARQRSHDTQTFVIINVRNIPQRDFFYFIPLNPLEQSINSIFFFIQIFPRFWLAPISRRENGAQGYPKTKWLTFWPKLNGRNAKIRVLTYYADR